MARPRNFVFGVGAGALAALVVWQLLAPKQEAASVAVPLTTIRIASAPLPRVQVGLDAVGRPQSLPAEPALVEALDTSSKMQFQRRLDLLHRVSAPALRPADVRAVLDYVTTTGSPHGFSSAQDRAFKNDLLNLVGKRPDQARQMAATLRVLYADPAQDEALRDYALQHLAGLVEHEASLGWDTHWKAVELGPPPLAATALLQLASPIRGMLPPEEKNRLGQAALRLASDETAPSPSRATALQVCARLKLPEARALAWDIARSDRSSIPFRIAAIATLGELGGDATIRAYLLSLATGLDKRLRVPAESALKRISIN